MWNNIYQTFRKEDNFMKTVKILAVCFVFLMGSVLLGGFSSKLGAEENITPNDPAGNDMVSGWEEPSTLIAKMEEWQKKPPVQQPDAIPGTACMGKFKGSYTALGGPKPSNLPNGTSQSCITCLQDYWNIGRPWSDAVRNCRQRCGCQ
jgi:hypothetical protein